MTELKKIKPDTLPNRQPHLTAKKPENAADLPDAIGHGCTDYLMSPANSAFHLISRVAISRGLGEFVDYPTMLEHLNALGRQVNAGDLSSVEQSLVASAKSLEYLSSNLMTKAMSMDQLHHFETYLKLGLRAQNQMRHSIETLGRLKNPPVVIAKQANVATNQQINHNLSHEPKPIQPIEQSAGEPHELCKNSRTPCDALSDDPSVEAVAKVHRRKD